MADGDGYHVTIPGGFYDCDGDCEHVHALQDRIAAVDELAGNAMTSGNPQVVQWAEWVRAAARGEGAQPAETPCPCSLHEWCGDCDDTCPCYPSGEGDRGSD